mgnify:CR=1 FL=1
MTSGLSLVLTNVVDDLEKFMKATKRKEVEENIEEFESPKTGDENMIDALNFEKYMTRNSEIKCLGVRRPTLKILILN